MDEAVFDLRNDIAEVPAKNDEAYFTLNMKLLEKVRALRAADSAEEGYEERLAAGEAELKAATYTVEMHSVPRRQREDLYEEAIEKFTPKLSFIVNQVDEKTEFQRGNFLRIAVVAAAITRIISPTGAVQEDNILDTIEFLHDKAPDEIFTILENKVRELNAAGDEQEDLHKSADF